MTNEERQREHSLLEQERKRIPELFNTEPLLDSPEMLRWIGIEDVFGEHPLGHIKYMPQDFIVEEIAGDKSISTIDIGEPLKDLKGEGTTHYCELVKVGMTTFEARDTLATLLGIPAENVATSGLKDEIAITSQRISLRKVQSLDELLQHQDENFFVKNMRRDKGVLKRGDLWGNRFLLTIRTPKNISEIDEKRIKKELSEIAEQGFWNFFSFQRFATPRLNGHFVGRHLLKGEYKEALENVLFFESFREEPYFRRIREAAKVHWRNWQAIEDLMKPFPSRFTTELQVLSQLRQSPNDLVGAFKSISEQVRLWVYAYASFLFNKKLSQGIRNGDVPFRMPFITSRFPADWELYADYLKEDGIRVPFSIYATFPFLRTPNFVMSPVVPTLHNVEIHNVHFLERMMIISFSLPKGAYATTFLAHLFQLSSEAPFPEGIDTTLIDAKEVLGIGSLSPVLERFALAIERIREERILGGR